MHVRYTYEGIVCRIRQSVKPELFTKLCYLAYGATARLLLNLCGEFIAGEWRWSPINSDSESLI